MRFECRCGELLCNIAYPNDVEFFLVSTRSQEVLQHLVEQQVERREELDSWPEIWEESGAIEIWKCPVCQRIYLNPGAKPEEQIVLSIEQI